MGRVSQGMDTPPAVRGTQCLKRALDLLRLVARHEETGVRLSALVKEAAIPAPTAHRILSLLVNQGFLSFDSLSHHYHVGFGLFQLGALARQYQIRERLRPLMEKIAQATGDSVYLLVPIGSESLCVDRVEGRYPIRALTLDVGVRRPMGIGAGSVALLAFLPQDRTDEILAVNRCCYHEHIKADDHLNEAVGLDRIVSMIREARKLGYAVSVGEFIRGVTAVALPVFDLNGQLTASISVSAISRRMSSSRRKEVVELIKREFLASPHLALKA